MSKRELKVNDYELAVMQSLGRIELLNKLILEALTSYEQAQRIYKEVCDTIRKEITEDILYKEDNNDIQK